MTWLAIFLWLLWLTYPLYLKRINRDVDRVMTMFLAILLLRWMQQ